jgi:hypothetical protein
MILCTKDGTTDLANIFAGEFGAILFVWRILQMPATGKVALSLRLRWQSVSGGQIRSVASKAAGEPGIRDRPR